MESNPELFNVRWNCEHFSAIFRNALTEMLERKRFVDVTLTCDGCRVDCHRVVLSACSPYFAELLVNERNTDAPMVICLVGVKSWQLHAIISLIYRGELSNITRGQFEELCKLANTFKIVGLMQHYESSMRAAHEDNDKRSSTETESSSEQDAPFPSTESILKKRKRNRKNSGTSPKKIFKVGSEPLSSPGGSNETVKEEADITFNDDVARDSSENPGSNQADSFSKPKPVDESDKILENSCELTDADSVSSSVQTDNMTSKLKRDRSMLKSEDASDIANKDVFREHDLNEFSRTSTPVPASLSSPQRLRLDVHSFEKLDLGPRTNYLNSTAQVPNIHHQPSLSSSVPVSSPFVNPNVLEYDLQLRLFYASCLTLNGISVGQAAAFYGLSELALTEFMMQQIAINSFRQTLSSVNPVSCNEERVSSGDAPGPKRRRSKVSK